MRSLRPRRAAFEIWGDMQMAAGATERLMELLGIVPEIAARRIRQSCLRRAAGDIRESPLLSARPVFPRWMVSHRSPGRWRSRPFGGRQSTVFQLLLLHDPQGGAFFSMVDVRNVDHRRSRAVCPRTAGDCRVRHERRRKHPLWPPEASTDVRAAARAARIDDFIMQLPRG